MYRNIFFVRFFLLPFQRIQKHRPVLLFLIPRSKLAGEIFFAPSWSTFCKLWRQTRAKLKAFFCKMWIRLNCILNFFNFRFRNRHFLKFLSPIAGVNLQCQSTHFHTGFVRQQKFQGDFTFNVTQHNAIHIPDPFPVFWATLPPPYPPPCRQNPSIFCRAKHISPRNILSCKFPALCFKILKSKRLCHRLKRCREVLGCTWYVPTK